MDQKKEIEKILSQVDRKENVRKITDLSIGVLFKSITNFLDTLIVQMGGTRWI